MYRKPTLNEKLKSTSLKTILTICIISILLGSFIFAFDLKITTVMMLVFILIFLSIYLLINSSGFKSDFVALFRIKSLKREILFLFTLLVLIPYPFYIIARCLVKMGILPRVFLFSTSTIIFKPYWAAILVLLIVGPILEELLFRGFLLNWLIKKLPFKKNNFLYAMVITSLIVSLIHGFSTFVPVFIMNIGLCIIYFKYDNLLINCILHILSNLEITFISLLAVFKVVKINNFIIINPFMSVVFVILGLIALVLYMVYLNQNYHLLKFHRLID